MVQPVVSGQHRFLQERLHTLRHLPPGTSLPQIVIREDRQLLDEILQLPDDIDVFSWLQENSNRSLTNIALRVIIEQLCMMCRDIHTAASEIPVPDYYQQLFGGLLNLSKDDFPFSTVKSLQDRNDEGKRLYDFFRQLQASYQQSPAPSQPFQGRTERDQVCADLLRLPPDTDPIFWLKNTHTLFVTQLILSHLLSRFSEPYGSVTALSTISMMKLKEHLRPSPAIDVTVERILFKSEGFLLQARATLSPKRFMSREEIASSNFTWQGFERVIDNHGYHYLTWIEEMHSGRANFRKQQEQITMAFYPTPGTTVRELTFSCQPVVIETNTLLQGKQRIQSSTIVADSVEWHLHISGRD
jgi:hypothetical protein